MKVLTSCALLLVVVPLSQGFVVRPSTSSFSSSSSTTALGSKSGPLPVRPIGIGAAAPKTVLTNKDLEKVVETSDEWIRTRTGISERHVLTGDDGLRDVAYQAAKDALEMAGVKPEELSLVIHASSSADDLYGDAPSIANRLGCNSDTMAYDLVAACSGFMFGIITASQFLSVPGSGAKKALVIGADSLTRWIDWDDRNTCILFGDGAGAIVLESHETPGIFGYAAHSNGGGYGDLNSCYNKAPRAIATSTPTIMQSGTYNTMAMNGKEVYKFATREVPTVCQEVLDAAGMTVDQVDWLVLHQANIRIMEVVAQRLGMPFEKVVTNLSKYGNTSAASIPLALNEAVRSGQVKKGDTIMMAGFGAGLSWGAALIKWGG